MELLGDDRAAETGAGGAVYRFFLPEDQRDLKLADEGEQQLQKPLAVLDQRLPTTPHISGPDFYARGPQRVASVLSWARMGKVNLASFPHVDQWLAGRLGRPAAVKARPQTMANRPELWIENIASQRLSISTRSLSASE